MRVSFLIAVLAAILGPTSFAQSASREAAWKKICEYDPYYCKKLKNADGTWIRPKKELLQAIQVMSPKIHEYARKFGVDPRAIAGSIVAENSLNVTVSDNIQDFLVKSGVASNGELFGKKFSFGWGQLNADVAQAAESHVARIEGRKPRTPREVNERLLTPDGAVYYVAATLRKIQDEYKSQGFDISKRPEIMTTVYNLGGESDKAAKLKRSGKAPRPNYFGFFVSSYLKEISSAVGPSTAKTSVSASGSLKKAPPLFSPVGSLPFIEQRTATLTTRKLKLVSSPPICSREASGNASEYLRVHSRQAFEPTTTVAVGSEYKILAPGLDCDLEKWSLIQTTGGQVGWVSDAILLRSSSKTLLNSKPCLPSENLACSQKVKGLSKSSLLSSKKTGLIEMKLQGPKKTVDYHHPTVHCADPIQFRTTTSGMKPATQGQAKALLTRIQALEDQAKNLFQTDDWMNSQNPYSVVSLSQLKNSLAQCFPTSDSSPSIPMTCYINFSDLHTVLSTQLKKAPTYKELKDFASHDWEIMMTQPQASAGTANSPESRRIKKSIHASLGKCKTSLKGFRKSLTYLDEIGSKLDQMTPSDYGFSKLTQYHTEISALCEQWKMIFNPPSDVTQPQANISSCQLFVGGPPRSGYINIRSLNVPVETLKGMLKTHEDRDEFHLAGIQSLINPVDLRVASASSGESKESCSYDPFKTAALIDKILQNKCVKAVYVPDTWLIKKLPNRNGRVIFRPMIENDRMKVDVTSNNCGASTQ